jgi:hypothetical protein
VSDIARFGLSLGHIQLPIQSQTIRLSKGCCCWAYKVALSPRNAEHKMDADIWARLSHTSPWTETKVWMFTSDIAAVLTELFRLLIVLCGINTVIHCRFAICGGRFATGPPLFADFSLYQRWVCKLYSADTSCFIRSIRMKKSAFRGFCHLRTRYLPNITVKGKWSVKRWICPCTQLIKRT